MVLQILDTSFYLHNYFLQMCSRFTKIIVNSFCLCHCLVFISGDCVNLNVKGNHIFTDSTLTSEFFVLIAEGSSEVK